METQQTGAMKTAQGPLAGIRVLDLTSVVLGPLATQILGDYGADIVKVEGPRGDMMRANGVSLHPGMSSIFLAVNRNKRSLCLDLTKAEGAAVLRRLISDADVLVHNMRVEAIERLGFGYEAVAALKPDIVYCAATGFDEDGPDAGKPAFDDIVQAASGLVALASIGRDTPDYVPSLIADKTAGMAVVNAVLAALFHHARTGEGQYVEVPMLETLTAFVLAEHLGGLTFESNPAPAGYARLLQGGRKPAPTRDGHIAILPYTLDHWIAFYRAAGRDDLADAVAGMDGHQRNAAIRSLYATIGEITATRTTAEWMAIAAEIDVPATPISALDDLPEHPQLKAVGLFQDMDHPSEGHIRIVRPPTKFAATPASVRLPAPLLGQHSRELLAEAGFSAGDIDALIAAQIITQKNIEDAHGV
ncbi:Formyl-CoA:oxalate CoA-transferase [Alphaproteobacteria bacterium SO-S41]|nr:Formyl-CoA:oxalate CoA-transferase [Alphaproteobacteria bacterium SO-S41]